MGGIPEEFISVSIQLSQVMVLTVERRQLMPETA